MLSNQLDSLSLKIIDHHLLYHIIILPRRTLLCFNIQSIIMYVSYYRRRDSNSYRHYCPGDFRTTIAFATKTILSVPLSIQVLSISVHLAHRKNLLNCVVCGLDSLTTILKCCNIIYNSRFTTTQ